MQRPHVAAPAKPPPSAVPVQTVGGVNDKCHSWRGHLDKRGGLILSFPRIVAVYWDPFFGDARNVARMDQFFRDVGKTAWLQGQEQFGVRPPLTLVSSVVVTTAAPAKLSRDQLSATLMGWLDGGRVGECRRRKRN
jgi:hypothetical protein